MECFRAFPFEDAHASCQVRTSVAVVAVGAVGAADAVDAVVAIGAVGTVGAVGAVVAVGTVGAVSAVDAVVAVGAVGATVGVHGLGPNIGGFLRDVATANVALFRLFACVDHSNFLIKTHLQSKTK